jgi:hypothetical protein
MIAAGELKIPPRIDVLYVEQEVLADDTPAVDAVLKADKYALYYICSFIVCILLSLFLSSFFVLFSFSFFFALSHSSLKFLSPTF